VFAVPKSIPMSFENIKFFLLSFVLYKFSIFNFVKTKHNIFINIYSGK
jgi:hypothetical protein